LALRMREYHLKKSTRINIIIWIVAFVITANLIYMYQNG
jgi:hypothetical protein